LAALEECVEVLMRVFNLQALKAIFLNEVDNSRTKARWVSNHLRENNGSLCIIDSGSVVISESARYEWHVVAPIATICHVGKMKKKKLEPEVRRE
jgi:hypothetical protein